MKIALDDSQYVDEYTDEKLIAEIIAVNARIAADKIYQEELQADLTRRKSYDAMTAMELTGKDFGEVSFRDGEGRKFKAKRELKVKWDNSKLQALASTMDWDTVQGIFKITFDVSETLYKALVKSNANQLLVSALDLARTTTPGELKVNYITE